MTIEEATKLCDAHVFVLADDGFGPLEGEWQWRLVSFELGFDASSWLCKVACYPESRKGYTKRRVVLSHIFQDQNEAIDQAIANTNAHLTHLKKLKKWIAKARGGQS